MNLPEGQDEYELTTMEVLGSWDDFPANATHLYKIDYGLSEAMRGPVRAFTHEVLWNSPAAGGFNLHALRKALSAAEEADKRLQEKQKIVSDRNREITEFQDRYEKLLTLNADMDKHLRSVRILLEQAAWSVTQAADATGREYQSIFPPSPE